MFGDRLQTTEYNYKYLPVIWCLVSMTDTTNSTVFLSDQDKEREMAGCYKYITH